MMKNIKTTFSKIAFLALLFGGFGLVQSCSDSTAKSPDKGEFEPDNQFSAYWYKGEAELTRYKLTQARYGQYHEGDAVMVFVTEDFDPVDQVKDNGRDNKKEPILKVNFSRKFWTGLYPYSIMTSVFTPVNSAKETIKISGSFEEWCGHSYMQLNLRDKSYEGTVHSYFPNEGDQTWKIKPDVLEDEIWTKIRINPEKLPTGDFTALPALAYLRLLHQEVKPQPATGSVEVFENEKVYSLKFKEIPRELRVRFSSEFPYEIIEWEEKFRPLMGNEEWMTTKAVKTHSMMLDYWNRNDVADSTYRHQLGL